MAYTDIDKPSDYFNTVLYTGTGATQSITGVNFQPDWVWIKCRNVANNHQSFDSVRGATKQLFPNINNAELTGATSLTSFDSDGFSLGNASGVNGSGQTHAAWNWLAGGTASSNTDGSITSTVSANTTSGFSIVTYTGNGSAGSTIGHNLGATPGLVIVKRRTGGANGWITWHNALTGLQYLALDLTMAATSNNSVWNSTTPTSSVFSVGTSASLNASGSTYVAYCFAEKKGYSKFGSYTGNGSSTDNTFVYTGFKPGFLIIKRTNSTSNWTMWDTTRQENEINKPLWGDLTNAESAQTTVKLDLLSNGFKIRGNGTNVGASGSTYIYMAFAENPFVTSTGIPTTAR